MNTDDPAYAEFKERYGDRVIGYESEDPTTEILARDIFQHLRDSLDAYRTGEAREFPLRDSVKVVSVKVWETSSSWAEFSA
jgi:6-pyruvoyltetrahydropterin/6-carboxytetrahydropterin synthase